MEQRRQQGGYAHDDAEIDIAGVSGAEGIGKGAEETVFIQNRPSLESFRVGEDQVDDPARNDKHEQNPEGGDDGDDQIDA